jgi:hypothetical protein
MPEDKDKEFFEINTWKELMITEDNSNLNPGDKGFIF